MRLLVMFVVLASGVAAAPARADRDLCGRGIRPRGTPIDLDVKGADVRDVFRLLADVGRVNLVVADDVDGKVTLRLARVAWDQIACTVAAMYRLRITVRDGILIVTRAAAAPR